MRNAFWALAFLLLATPSFGKGLEPKIQVFFPRAGTVLGGTRVWILGEGFEAPAIVEFGDIQVSAAVLSSSQLVVEVPAGRAIGAVPVRVTNFNTNLTVSASEPYEYREPIVATAVGPNAASMRGGTQVHIAGSGFEDPVGVTIAGIGAQVVSVTPEEIVAIAPPLTTRNCSDRTVDVRVSSFDTGEATDALPFRYFAEHPMLADIPDVFLAGTTMQVTLVHADRDAQLILGNTEVKIQGARENANGTTAFMFKVPDLVPASSSCTAAPAFATSLRYISARTGCATYDLVHFQPAQYRGCAGAAPPRRGVE